MTALNALNAAVQLIIFQETVVNTTMVGDAEERNVSAGALLKLLANDASGEFPV